MLDLGMVLEDIDNRSPLLLMGSSVLDFKRMYKGPIKIVRDNDSVRELVSYYSSIVALDRPLVIDDLSFLSSMGVSLLLKLVEESTFPVILLSMFDSVDSILLSRVKTVIKYSKDEIKSEFLPIGKGYTRIEESLSEDSHIYDRFKYMSKFSPLVYYVEKSIGRIKNKNKIYELLG